MHRNRRLSHPARTATCPNNSDSASRVRRPSLQKSKTGAPPIQNRSKAGPPVPDTVQPPAPDSKPPFAMSWTSARATTPSESTHSPIPKNLRIVSSKENRVFACSFSTKDCRNLWALFLMRFQGQCSSATQYLSSTPSNSWKGNGIRSQRKLARMRRVRWTCRLSKLKF